MQTCIEHEGLIRSIERLTDRMDLVVDNLSMLKVQMAERNAYLKGIRRGVQLAAGVITCLGAQHFGLDLGALEKLLKLFAS